MARIYPICSSSKGNSTFIGTRGHGILVDAGCSFRALGTALSLIDTDLDGIEALFITHEHIDHIKALDQIFKHTRLPVFASGGTIEALREMGKIPGDAQLFDIKDGYRSALFEVSAFRTSHDSAESVGYAISFGKEKFGVCTDTGFVTEDAEKALAGCRTVLLESNYDEEMLRKNLNYPPELKRRISGDRGHLSNGDSADFALKLLKNGTRHLVLGHLSQENNTPSTARTRAERLFAENGAVIEKDYTLNVAPVMTNGDYIGV